MSEDNSNKRIHPDERSRIAALNTAGQALHGKPWDKTPTSYYAPFLIQCTLPHSDPKARDWKKSNGGFTLIVSSGVDDNLEPYGIPYGSFPRLTLAYIITKVIQTKTRRIELASHFSGFLKEIGYTGNLKGNIRPAKAVQNQLLRLLCANIAFEKTEGNGEQGAILRGKADIADAFALWWNYKQPEQGSLWGSYIELSETFYQAILANPIPLRTDVLKALKKSPLALDVYMWVSYRLFTLQSAGQEQVTLSYGRLQEQFGTGIAEENYRQFRRELRLALQKVAQYWVSPSGEKQLLHYELHEEGLTLFRSPMLVKAAKQSKESDGLQALATRKFDTDTLKRARMIAGNWDIRFLETQYFLWIERRGITPKKPASHFLTFIKAHLKRHGDSP